MERELDPASDLAFVEQALQHAGHVRRHFRVDRQRPVEGRHVLLDGGEQLVVGQPDEVIEDDGHRPPRLLDVERDVQAVAGRDVAIFQAREETGGRHLLHGVVEIDGVTGWPALRALKLVTSAGG